MLKISDLKRIKKLCFDKIARNSIDSKTLAVHIRPLGLELVEVLMSNGSDYARLLVDADPKNLMPEINLSWIDFVKICELFIKEVSITKKEKTIKVIEGKTVLICKIFSTDHIAMCNFKFDFDKATKLKTSDLFMLDDHLLLQKYAIIGDKLVSCDGQISIMNKLDADFGEKPILYADKFPADNWYITKDGAVVVSEDKRIAFTHRQATGDYPIGVLKLAQQPLSNSFECDSKVLFEKIQQCSLIYEVMNIKFGKDELIISTTGVKKCEATYETILPVKFDHPTERVGFQFSIKYLSYFCKCADKRGKVKILFDDSETVHMFRTENEKYIIFGMGIARAY